MFPLLALRARTNDTMVSMFPAIAKYVGGKVLTAVLVVTAVLIVIWYYRAA